MRTGAGLAAAVGVAGDGRWRRVPPHAVLLSRRDEARALPLLLPDLPPDRLRPVRDARGRPRLDGGVGVSFSRRDELVLVGAARGLRIGVDLERVSEETPAIEIADALFAPEEAAMLRALPRARRALAFAALWTGKEAVLKAAGVGIARDGLARPRLDRAPALERLRRRGVAGAMLEGGVRIGWRALTVDGRPMLAATATLPASPDG